MLTISKPLSAGQALRYHQEEFRNGAENYYAEDERIIGTWHGQLAATWQLAGDVREEDFARLAEGQHPHTGEQLVRHQTPHLSTNVHGESVTTMEHRAGWDATFSAPKTVSLTALVGGDDRVRDAHDASVEVALNELEHYAQARLGGNHPAETTENWVAAKFEHDSARPVDGYAAPQLHTHVVVFNLTETQDGEIRPLQPRELFKTQQYATAVYRSELATRLTALGYEIERGSHGQPEIAGYSPEYVEASSPRRKQIEEHLATKHQTGAEASEIAAHKTRGTKRDLSREEVQRQHRAVAETFGDQPAHVVHAAHEREHGLQHDVEHDVGTPVAHTAVTFGQERNLEREAVVDEREILRDALTRSMGDGTVGEIKAEFERRVESGDFVVLEQRPGDAGRSITTPEMIALERETLQMMAEGKDTHPALATVRTRTAIERGYSHLNQSQRTAVDQILGSHDQVQALEGVAGAGKTTALSAVRDAAEREGYHVEGLAPTSRAAQKLSEAGIESGTLQRHLAGEEPQDGQKRLYVLDESSLASTTQMNAFLHRLQAEDRVLLVGDTRQHQAVDAGRPYQQLQDVGMSTAKLDAIVRQQDPDLKHVVEQLSNGDVRGAIHGLDAQGRVHEIADRDQRFSAIAREYVKQPAATLVVSPDNQSRRDINDVIHRAMQTAGHVEHREHRVSVLIARQDITGADREWAERYDPGDLVRFTKGSKTLGIEPGEYARVEHVQAKDNLVTVARDNGASVTYDPRRLHGVTLYREAERAFATGDRVQFTAPDRERHVANRELGTIERIDDHGQLLLRLDSGRTLAFQVRDQPHLDYGYAVTSHSSQGQTADRVLVHVDAERAGEKLVNQRLAYVAVSRGRYDAQIYTNDKAQLGEALGRESSHRSAIDQSVSREPGEAVTAPTVDRKQSVARTIGHGMGR
jgi:conjugative relaxase-like TrwC/TraI family protein